jgi:hypothetical protein
MGKDFRGHIDGHLIYEVDQIVAVGVFENISSLGEEIQHQPFFKGLEFNGVFAQWHFV